MIEVKSWRDGSAVFRGNTAPAVTADDLLDYLQSLLTMPRFDIGRTLKLQSKWGRKFDRALYRCGDGAWHQDLRTAIEAHRRRS